MKRRSRAGGEASKARRSKTVRRKRPNAPNNDVVHHVSSAAGAEGKLVRLTRELNEALERQAATSEVLQIISASPGDLQPVFAAMLENAVRICDANFGNIYRWDGEALHMVATHNTPPAFAEDRRRSPYRPYPQSPIGRMVIDKTVAHISDLAAEEVYLTQKDPAAVSAVALGGTRTLLGVPLLNKDEMIGAFFLSRQEVRPFNEKQIALVKNFAAQAVVAVENTRLLNELRQRTDDLSERTADLTEALEQQTATSEVLQVISGSSGDLQPAFRTVLENAVRLCGAKFGTINRWDGEALHLAATHKVPPAFAEFRRRTPFRPGPENPISGMLMTKTIIHFHDLAMEQGYIELNPTFVAAVELGGVRTFLAVPMLKENDLIGVIIVYRQEVRPFSEKQIELVKNFAAQAVIAIENARLLNELRQSLEQQTATAEVLKVVSRSPGDLQPVFATMLENAVRICGANFGNMFLYENETYRAVAMHNAPEAYARLRTDAPLRPPPGTALGRVAATKQVVQITDLMMEDAYKQGASLAVTGVAHAGIRTLLAVPMLKDDHLVGAIVIYRREVRLFDDKQIELVKNFAAQAVIAIENARLLNELRQRTTDLTETLEQQTATADVLEVISRSAFDLQAVFETVAESSVRLCGADRAFIFRFDGEFLRMAVAYNSSAEFAEWVANHPIPPGRHSGSARAALERRTIHVPDVLADPEYTYGAKDVEPIRTILGVPILKGDDLLGVMMIYRLEVRPFTDKQIALVETFADQAAIAIENVRLLEELRERTNQLEARSQEVVKLNQQLEHRVADQVSELERMGRLRRFLPPQVADLIVASGTEKQLESHRREITALFCDLRGFTGFSESADPEDVMALLRDYHAAIGEIIIKYSGTLERYAGDGVMVVFNDPVPVHNPALQAVLMALEMRGAIGALTDKWRQLGHDLGFGIGIAHGFATLGTIGFEGRFDYAAIGTVSNVASRLCDEAKPGQILVSPRVLMAVADAVKVEPVGEFALKGIRRPLAAYNVLSDKSPNI